ncbi:MAG: C40 family peptidase [Pedobacter sp.]
MEQLFGICRVSIAPMRSEPSDKAENSSQLLFGDFVEVIEQQERWWYIRSSFEGYEGWVDFRQLTLTSKADYLESNNLQYLAPAQAMNILIDPQDNKLYLSAASNLPNFKDGYCFLGNQQYKVLFEPIIPRWTNIDALIFSARFFLNTPYLWGGRSFFGIDCSGFVQNVFKLNGFPLRRDAWQQAEQGQVVDFLQEVQPGDVAFFDNDEGRITHVGIMLNSSEIIHSSSKVKIDPIDSQGIFNEELGKYTHKLRIIKRLI